MVSVISLIYPDETKTAGGKKIKSLFQSLEYGPAPESPAVVNAWLDDHGRSFGHFINGEWVKPPGRKTYDSFNPVNGEKIATTVQGNLVLGFLLSLFKVFFLVF